MPKNAEEAWFLTAKEKEVMRARKQRDFMYTPIQANYLTIPVYAMATIAVGVLSFLSDRLNTRVTLLAVVPIPVIIGYAIVIRTANIAASYFAMFLVASSIYIFNYLVLTWISINLALDYKRSVSIPIFVSVANVSGVLSSNIYPATDAPRYIIRNSVSLALLRSCNMKKEKLIADGETENGKEGDRGLYFKYLL
ncbi:hypothetical protein V499_01090 [Pseudogymnoascus sp. VKM F-103]|nr:hypothetical protein V499_01090 [Pseudogymnoascus sp. VKM F-103]